MDAVAKAIVDEVLRPDSGSPSIIAPNPTRLLLNLVERNAPPEDIAGFLKYHSEIISPRQRQRIDVAIGDSQYLSSRG
jgi:hypothetical protein